MAPANSIPNSAAAATLPPMRVLALFLILAAAAWRVLALHAPELSNFSPLMALAFCGGVYFTSRWMWCVPFAALAASDLYIDHYYSVQYGYHWGAGGVLLRLLCFAAGLGLGRVVSGRRRWSTLAAGALGASILFYLVTNTAAFLGDAAYAHTFAGWLGALTVGHPGLPSTLYFFRNTFVSDLLFTGGFALAMEYAARREGSPSLLGRRA
jgi:hypothetical protein